MGRRILSVLDFRKGRSGKRTGPTLATAFLGWYFTKKRPGLPGGWLHLHYERGGLCRFEPPHTFPACEAGTLGGAVYGNLSVPKEVTVKLHVNWCHTSAQQWRRLLAGSNGDSMHLVNYVDEVLEQCEVCRAMDKAPQVPTAGTSASSKFFEELEVDVLFLDDITTMRAMAALPENPPPIPGRSQNPRGDWGRLLRCVDWGLWPT